MSTASPTLERPLSDGLHIIVADDDPNEQLLLAAAASALEPASTLEFVADGAELLDLVARRCGEHREPDLIVLDLRMPRMDGHEALRHLASRPESSALPVLIWTTSQDPDDPEQCWNEGAWWFESKPEGFDGYLDLIRSVPDRCARARQLLASEPDWHSLLDDAIDDVIDDSA